MTGVEGEVGEGEKGKRGQTYQIDTRRKARAEQRRRAALYLRLVHREIRMLYYMYVCVYVCVCGSVRDYAQSTGWNTRINAGCLFP